MRTLIIQHDIKYRSRNPIAIEVTKKDDDNNMVSITIGNLLDISDDEYEASVIELSKSEALGLAKAITACYGIY